MEAEAGDGEARRETEERGRGTGRASPGGHRVEALRAAALEDKVQLVVDARLDLLLAGGTELHRGALALANRQQPDLGAATKVHLARLVVTQCAELRRDVNLLVGDELEGLVAPRDNIADLRHARRPPVPMPPHLAHVPSGISVGGA